MLILSEGKSLLKVTITVVSFCFKSFSHACTNIKVDCHVPVLPGAQAPLPQLPPELLAQLRQYITLCRGLAYSLSNEMKLVRMKHNNIEQDL